MELKEKITKYLKDSWTIYKDAEVFYDNFEWGYYVYHNEMLKGYRWLYIRWDCWCCPKIAIECSVLVDYKMLEDFYN